MKDKRKTREKKPLSFAIYVMGAFLLTSAMTVLITAAAIAIVWNVGYAGEPGDEELFFAVFTAGAIALLLSVILGIYFAVGIARPVQRISDTASAIKEGNLSARTGLSGDDQLGQLGQRFDEMADAIERDRDLERQLIGDVAHELRTPLMAIQATVEAIQDGVFEADEEHLNTISFETRRRVAWSRHCCISTVSKTVRPRSNATPLTSAAWSAACRRRTRRCSRPPASCSSPTSHPT